MALLFWFLLTLDPWLVPSFSLTPPPMAAKLTDEERQWLRMVDFIITSEERKIFRKRLTTTSERRRFIDLFWAKRDPDLTDSLNPFRDSYLARYDYVTTNYETSRKRIPKDHRSYVYMLLGKPDRTETRVEVSLLGPRYNNPFPHHPPELWTYEAPGYKFQRSRLRIQFLPTSPFGDYKAYLDAYSGNWLRNLKNTFIVNPDLERAPLTDTTGTRGGEVIDAVSRTTAVDTPLPEEDAGREIAQVPVSVPARVAAENDLSANLAMDTDAGNAMGIRIKTGFFSGGRDSLLLLARLGFPLASLNFDFKDDQYQSNFVMSYRFETADGRILTADKFQNDLKVPDRSVFEGKSALYTKELAILLDPGIYQLHVQVADQDGQRRSYYRETVDIPPLSRELIDTTPLTLMDPNVSEDAAKFSVNGRPMGLHLTGKINQGERLYPILEIFGKAEPDVLETAQIHAIKKGQRVHTWVLFPDEEISPSAHGTHLAHPTLRTNQLDPGTYLLRFELERPTGELVLSQTEVIIE